MKISTLILLFFTSISARAVVSDQVSCQMDFRGGPGQNMSTSAEVGVSRIAEPVPSEWESGTWMTRGTLTLQAKTEMKSGFKHRIIYRHVSRLVDGQLISKINYCPETKLFDGNFSNFCLTPPSMDPFGPSAAFNWREVKVTNSIPTFDTGIADPDMVSVSSSMFGDSTGKLIGEVDVDCRLVKTLK